MPQRRRVSRLRPLHGSTTNPFRVPRCARCVAVAAFVSKVAAGKILATTARDTEIIPLSSGEWVSRPSPASYTRSSSGSRDGFDPPAPVFGVLPDLSVLRERRPEAHSALHLEILQP